jgi:hypothetical protein
MLDPVGTVDVLRTPFQAGGFGLQVSLIAVNAHARQAKPIEHALHGPRAA